jgi:hypothetical protein
MKPLGFLLLLLAPALGGCTTQWFGSAASPTPGKVYVVGGYSGQHAIWLCPVDGDDTPCTRVEIQE